MCGGKFAKDTIYIQNHYKKAEYCSFLTLPLKTIALEAKRGGCNVISARPYSEKSNLCLKRNRMFALETLMMLTTKADPSKAGTLTKDDPSKAGDGRVSTTNKAIF